MQPLAIYSRPLGCDSVAVALLLGCNSPHNPYVPIHFSFCFGVKGDIAQNFSDMAENISCAW